MASILQYTSRSQDHVLLYTIVYNRSGEVRKAVYCSIQPVSLSFRARMPTELIFNTETLFTLVSFAESILVCCGLKKRNHRSRSSVGRAFDPVWRQHMSSLKKFGFDARLALDVSWQISYRQLHADISEVSGGVRLLCVLRIGKI